MREIKFRAWDQYDDKWRYFKIGESFGQLGESLYKSLCLEGAEFQQFTGLRDKNGNEIYSGDILKDGEGKNMVVGWSEKFASFVLNRKGWVFSHWFGESCNPEYCEVVGNIHENLELLPELLQP